MYRNLDAEMVIHRLIRKDIFKLLKVRYATIVEKLNGKCSFKFRRSF